MINNPAQMSELSGSVLVQVALQTPSCFNSKVGLNCLSYVSFSCLSFCHHSSCVM